MGFRHNFIIGLGGTGGAAVKAFREIEVERREEHRELLHQGRRFEYLYIDSNKVDIDRAAGWEHLGEAIGLVTGAESLLIAVPAGSKASSFCKLQHVRPWIGGGATVEDIVNAEARKIESSGAIQGAGQRRRYGRLLAASKAGDIRARIDAGMRRLVRDLAGDDRKVTFHVFATLGGGTGSGSIVDVLTMIPQLSAQLNLHCKVIAYLFVGAGSVTTSNVGYFFQNEYCALRDINALMANRYRPYRALMPAGRNPFHDKADPIDAVYISTEENGVSLDKQVRRFAASCYDLISFVPSNDSNAGRAFSGEDIYPTNPGEESVVEFDSLINEDVVAQHLPTAVGGVDQFERSYRFQTLSSVRAKHPVVELHGILTCALAQKVLEQWLNGDIRCRNDRDKTIKGNPDIFTYEKKDAVILKELDAAYREERIKEYNRYTTRLAENGYTASSLDDVLKKTKSMADGIHSHATTEVQPAPGMDETDLQRICRQQAKADRNAIIAALEKRRKRTSGATAYAGTAWGIADIITYLNNLQAELSKRGIEGVPAAPEGMGNMRRRAAEWDKLGALSFKTTPLPSRMYTYQVDEGRSIVEQYCDIRLESIRRVRNKILSELLAEDINLYNQAVMQLETQMTRLTTEQNRYRSRLGGSSEGTDQSRYGDSSDGTVQNTELHDGDACVSVWNGTYLKNHVDFYLDNAMCADEVARTMIACELRFDTIAKQALDLVQPVAGGGATKAKALVDDLLKPTEGLLWVESNRIHAALCARLGSEKYEKAYAETIYDYLADKDGKYLDALTDKIMNKVASSAAITVEAHGGSTAQDTDIELGPWKAACLGMLSSEGMQDAAGRAYAAISGRLSSRLMAISSDSRYMPYRHTDVTEIRVSYTQYYMPLRFFQVVDFLETKYTSKMDSASSAALYFSNIDDDGMLEPCPDRPDLLPETDPKKHMERKKAAQNQKQNRVAGGLEDNGNWDLNDTVTAGKQKPGGQCHT